MPIVKRKKNINQIIRFLFFFFLLLLVFSRHTTLAEEITFEDVKEIFQDDTDESKSTGTFDSNTAYLAVDKGIATGASLDMSSSSQLHRFNVYGRAVGNNSEKIIEIGYKKRF